MVSLEPVLISISSLLKDTSGSVCFTTSELGGHVGVSQQTASRYLKQLQERGWIERSRAGHGFEVRLTEEGIAIIRQIHANLGQLLDSDFKTFYEGKIVSGIGEGAYYISEYSDRIFDKVGYRPFNGTLNVRVRGGRPDMNTAKTVEIAQFKSKNRSFGGVGLTPVKLHVKRQSIDCHVIVPERTHHRKDLELIADKNLKEEYGLEDGDNATITFM